MAKKHSIIAKVNNSIVTVKIYELEKNVFIKNHGQRSIKLRDLMENGRIYDAFVKYCYGYVDDDMIKTIELDYSIAPSDCKKLSVSIVSVLVQEYYDEKIAKDRAEREAERARKAGRI